MSHATNVRHLAGTEEYVVEVDQRHGDDIDDITVIFHRTYTTRAGAVRAIRRELTRFRRYDIAGSIIHRRWEAAEFTDALFGHILDADAKEIATAYLLDQQR